MQVQSVELVRLRIPFKKPFAHAAARREESDMILVIIKDDQENLGFGEILARKYVSGETNNAVYEQTGPTLAKRLVGRGFHSLEELERWICSAKQDQGPALSGGFELALLHAFAFSNPIDLDKIIGPTRVRTAGRCYTVGFETPLNELRRAAVEARMGGATVVKMKVGDAGDVQRLRQLNEHFKGNMPLRLDANGSLSMDSAEKLLSDIRGLPVESLEEPFSKANPLLPEQLKKLYESFGVMLIADESLCHWQDAERWIALGCYQGLNVRVGKCGLLDCVRIIRAARGAGLTVVCGTMVGESGVLNQASRMLLEHTDELDYVEGLDQNESILTSDPVTRIPAENSNPFGVIHVRSDLPANWILARHEFD